MIEKKRVVNAAANSTVSSGRADVIHDSDNSVAAKVRLVELEALVGNLYLAKDFVSKPVSGEQAVYTTNQQ